MLAVSTLDSETEMQSSKDSYQWIQLFSGLGLVVSPYYQD